MTTPFARHLRIALLIGLVSAGLRLAWAAGAQVTPISDFELYHKHAVKLLEEGQFGFRGRRAYITPAYPLFLAGIYALAGCQPKAAQLVQTLLGGCSSAMLVYLGARLISLRTGGIAGLLHAFSLTALSYTALLASENLAAPLLLGSLLALLASQRAVGLRRLVYAGLAGALCAGLMLTRPAAVFMAPAFLLVAVWRPLGSRWSLATGLAWAASLALVMLPWSLRNQALGYSPLTLSTHGGYSWYGWIRKLHPKGAATGLTRLPRGVDEQARDRAARQAVRGWIASHPGRYARITLVQAARAVGTTADGWATSYIFPTARRDALMVAIQNHVEPVGLTAEQARAENLARDGARRVVSRLRRISAPLALVAAVLCLWRFRTFCPVLLPAGLYLAGVAGTIFIERYRELSNPLMMLLMAALLSDLIWDRGDLCPGLRRRTKLIVTGAAILAALTVHAADLTALLYDYPYLGS
jgi:4-amino-4-deoxy-L-arabinose transferase-like glycosyltransferase